MGKRDTDQLHRIFESQQFDLSKIFEINDQYKYGVEVNMDSREVREEIYKRSLESEKLIKISVNKQLNYPANVRGLSSNISDKKINEFATTIDILFLRVNGDFDPINKEISRWFSKVSVGGVICGNGYDETQFPQIKKNLEHFFGRFDWEIHHVAGGNWWIRKEPLSISYIIPAYNCESSIKESLDSIINGNLCQGDEIVVVNDCSSDQTESILKKYYEIYPNIITLIRHSKNKGGAAARNTAVRNSKNKLIFCLDSDNVLVPESVGLLKEYLIKSDADAAAFQELRYFQKKTTKVTHRWIFREGQVNFSDCIASVIVPISSGNYLYTKKSWIVVDGYPEFAKALDAWGFGLRQVGSGQKLFVLANTWYFHRYGHQSYWKREHAIRGTSLLALEILSPFLNKLDKSSIDYLSTEGGKNSWFNSLENFPIKLKNVEFGSGGVVINHQIFKQFFIRLIEKIKSYYQGQL